MIGILYVGSLNENFQSIPHCALAVVKAKVCGLSVAKQQETEKSETASEPALPIRRVGPLPQALSIWWPSGAFLEPLFSLRGRKTCTGFTAPPPAPLKLVCHSQSGYPIATLTVKFNGQSGSLLSGMEELSSYQ